MLPVGSPVMDRVGQVWAMGMFSSSSAAAPLVLVVASNTRAQLHRLLVLDGGTSWWKVGSLRTHGELVEWPNSSIGPKRIA